MGADQLSLQAGSYKLAARLEESQRWSRTSVVSSQDDVSSRDSRRKQSRSNSPVQRFGFFQSKCVASRQSLEGLMQPSPPRHSTACCDGLSERREVERRLSSQKMKVSGAAVQQHDSSEHSSFRSEDSESLALWEEKEPASAEHGWMKQSPRWLGAMRRFRRSSPDVHPKCSLRDTSLDRKSSQRSLHDASNKSSWYTKKIRSGESPSVPSPTVASDLLRRSGELVLPSQWDHDDSKHGSLSRLTDEATRLTASAGAWDIPLGHDSQLAAQPKPRNDLAWEIPADASHEKFVDANSVQTTKDTVRSVTDKSVVLSDGQQCEAFVDGQSGYASCRTFSVDSDSTSKSSEFVNVIGSVAPLLSKPPDDAASATPRVPFKWAAPQGKRVDEVSPATETPQPPSVLSRDGFLSFESLREQNIVKSKSAPLDGLYVLVPKTAATKPRPPRVSIKEDSFIPDSFLMKSRSSNDTEGRALHDHRLFTKLRKSVFGSPSPLGLKNEFVEPSSPRSILRGPDDGSVPSSNPSLRSDPGTPAFPAIPNSSGSQSMSSCSASFDLNEYETTYDMNSTAACIIVESRRVSLSFRDFGPARPSGEEKTGDDVSETTIELERFNPNGLGSLPKTMQSPELWTATFSTRYSDAPASPSSDALDQPASSVTAPSQQQAHEVQVPIVIQKSRSRNSEFTARLGLMFSPLRLISSHEPNHHSCFTLASTLSPPHEVDEERSPTHASTLEFLSTSEFHSSSSTKGRKAKSSWTHGEKVKPSPKSSTTRRHSSDDSHTMMVFISKAMKKILAKMTVKRSTSKGKSKMESPMLETLPPIKFHFTEVS